MNTVQRPSPWKLQTTIQDKNITELKSDPFPKLNKKIYTVVVINIADKTSQFCS